MSDLIERQLLIDRINKKLAEVYQYPKTEYAEGYVNACKAARQMISEIPSAQPERKKGHWIKHLEQKNIYGGMYIECSECGEEYVVQYIKDEKFCRNCGAYMGGDT